MSGRIRFIRGHFVHKKHLNFVHYRTAKGEHALPPGLQENV